MKAALRDMLRSSYFGSFIRSEIVLNYRKYSRLLEAKRVARKDPTRFCCPICQYEGSFIDRRAGKEETKSLRKYAICPKCGSAERHRLQFLVLNQVLESLSQPTGSVLHFAPEAFLQNDLKSHFQNYRTVDLFRRDVDIKADITDLPIEDNSVDLVYASHVLEHVPEDSRAISEVHRILRPGGIAILPVPIYSVDDQPARQTVEYGRAVKEEDGHVRAPGLDYFDRYRAIFDRVTVISSAEFGSKSTFHQLFIRPLSENDQRNILFIPDFVPVCCKSSVLTSTKRAGGSRGS